MKTLAKLFQITRDVAGETIQTAKRAAAADHTVVSIRIEDIFSNPFQPRKEFEQESLRELSESIREFGILQPLLVRKAVYGYELIAGERRLRAAKLAGLKEVPVLVKEMNDQEIAEVALIENLQREDLHFLEEAEGLAKLMEEFGFTQEKLAVRMGRKQSTIANKLRLLRLPTKMRKVIRKEKLSERHARTLLTVEDEDIRWQVLDNVVKEQLTVRQMEILIRTLKRKKDAYLTKEKKNIIHLVRDARIFLNTIQSMVDEMKKSGLAVQVEEKQERDHITVTMMIPKR